MGNKGKDNRGKGKNRVCSEAYRVLPTEDNKTIVGENQCNNICFRPLSGYCQKMTDRVNRYEFFPKRRIYASFGKNSTVVMYFKLRANGAAGINDL